MKLKIYEADFIPESKEDFKNLLKFYAELLLTCHRIIDNEEGKQHHKTHPHMKWVMESRLHYNYLFNLFYILAEKYQKEYGKEHFAYKKLKEKLQRPPEHLQPTKKIGPIPLIY